MANLNKVYLIGRLTRDPELRYTPNGTAVTDLGLATNRFYTTKDGERREEVTFIDVTVWNRQAENCCQFLKKGRLVHIEGALRMDSWTDQASGQKRSKLKVEAENVQFLEKVGGPGGGEPASGEYEEEYPPPPARESRSAPAGGSPARDAGARGSAPAGAGGSGPRGNYAGNGPASGAATRRPAAPTPPPAPESSGEDDDIPF